jgi:hypothetical protein
LNRWRIFKKHDFRKYSLADFGEDTDVKNSFPGEKVSRKNQEDRGAEGLYFVKDAPEGPPFLDLGVSPPLGTLAAFWDERSPIGSTRDNRTKDEGA